MALFVLVAHVFSSPHRPYGEKGRLIFPVANILVSGRHRQEQYAMLRSEAGLTHNRRSFFLAELIVHLEVFAMVNIPHHFLRRNTSTIRKKDEKRGRHEIKKIRIDGQSLKYQVWRPTMQSNHCTLKVFASPTFLLPTCNAAHVKFFFGCAPRCLAAALCTLRP